MPDINVVVEPNLYNVDIVSTGDILVNPIQNNNEIVVAVYPNIIDVNCDAVSIVVVDIHRGPAGLIQSVTGLATNNSDPANPVVKIEVDGITIGGDGTPSSPLVSYGGGGQVDSIVAGVGIGVNGTDPANPVIENTQKNVAGEGIAVDNTDLAFPIITNIGIMIEDEFLNTIGPEFSEIAGSTGNSSFDPSGFGFIKLESAAVTGAYMGYEIDLFCIPTQDGTSVEMKNVLLQQFFLERFEFGLMGSWGDYTLIYFDYSAGQLKWQLEVKQAWGGSYIINGGRAYATSKNKEIVSNFGIIELDDVSGFKQNGYCNVLSSDPNYNVQFVNYFLVGKFIHFWANAVSDAFSLDTTIIVVPAVDLKFKIDANRRVSIYYNGVLFSTTPDDAMTSWSFHKLFYRAIAKSNKSTKSMADKLVLNGVRL